MPATMSLVPMGQAQFVSYLQRSTPAYARDKIASGAWAEAEALGLAQKEVDELLPAGLATPDHHFYVMQLDRGQHDGGQHADAAEAVGMLWIAAQRRGAQKIAYVYDVMVEPAHRRQGHAARAFAALEREVLALGLSGIALHVFGHNLAAQALYAKLGYLPTNINMFKPLGGAGPASP